MLRVNAPVVAVLCVIVCVLLRPAPLAGNPKVAVVVSAAVFERVTVLNSPAVTRSKLAPAALLLARLHPSATAIAVGKHPRPPLWRHRLAVCLLEWVAHLAIQCTKAVPKRPMPIPNKKLTKSTTEYETR